MSRIRKTLCGLWAMAATLALHVDAAIAHGPDGHAPKARARTGYEGPHPSALGGPWTLTDHTGREVSDETFRGEWTVIFFGFTSCREACPVGLEHITQAIEHMGEIGNRVRPLFVDFSMEEPDIKGLAQFVSNFHPRMLGLVGTRKQMFTMIRNYQVIRDYIHMVRGAKETGPRINHTTYFYLVNPDGRAVAYFYHDVAPERMATFMQRHMAQFEARNSLGNSQ